MINVQYVDKKIGKIYEEFVNVYIHDIDLINYFFGDKIKVKNVNYSTNKMSYIEMESQNMPILFKLEN